MRPFSSWRQLMLPTLFLLLLSLLGTPRPALAQCAPSLVLEKTSQGSVSCNCNSTYRLKASSYDGSGYFTFRLQAGGVLTRVANQPDADGYTTLISNLVGYASYDVTVNYYGRTCSGTTQQTIVVPADTPGGGSGGGGNPGPQQEESTLTGPVSSAATGADDPAGRQAAAAVTAYPNPASDQLLIPVRPQAVGGTLQLLDARGRVVRQLVVRDATQPVHLDTRELAPGLYRLRVPGQAKAQCILLRP